ncbi:DNA processing protein [Salinibacterium amurskyense]|uniref:DNA processing protein n=2 Tax=Salinibacterium amurskyense TaxID=205941 RepID=A0A2M9D8A8_9MICO|nr:DNA-processing protein DprA [Salinibacterium amurskyense]PJJ81966.1 DNA processing protein [Salinibacterium amurskyense]GHD78650.1 DNA processing protein DprA [Salinibacterium amurskyense]
MTMFGLKESEVATLVRAVSVGGGEDFDRDAIEERFARATWSGLAEPGDRLAGRAIQQLGAVRALTAVVEHWDPERFAATLSADGDAVGDDDMAQAIDRWMPRLKSNTALIALRQAARFGARLLTPDDTLWPSRLNDLDWHAPSALWVRGTDEALAGIERGIALVGARAATGYGEHITMEASAGLVDRGYTIVSGAAYGIDGMAHRAALASHGLTVAFLAGGVDRFYPSGHDALLGRIVENGVVISELPCGSPPTKWRFLQRNRLIAAASMATVVLEAGWRSGSLNTAGHAATLGRPLGAVPGPVTSAASAGCHRLIRDYDAVCVTNPDQMAELAPLEHALLTIDEVAGAEQSAASSSAGSDSSSPRDTDAVRLLDALSARSARSADDVAARSGLAISTVRAQLGLLELDGRVTETERGWKRVASERSRRA